MFVAGIGWAKPVPVNPIRFRMKNRKLGMAITALAGPAMNFALAFVCLLVVGLMLCFVPVDLGRGGSYVSALYDLLSAVATMSVGLGLFNLIPIPPLDGSKVLMPVMPNSVIQWVWRNQGFISFGFMILIFFGAFGNFIGPIMRDVINGMLGFILNVFGQLGYLS
jgi:Zn-dependent protease